MVPTPTSSDCLSEILKAQMQPFDSPALTVKQHSPTKADPVATVETKYLGWRAATATTYIQSRTTAKHIVQHENQHKALLCLDTHRAAKIKATHA